MIPLEMVHGFMGGRSQWDPQVPALSPHYDLITLDLPGFGRNAHLPVLDNIGGFADWVIAQLRQQGVTRYHLLGHSMGGMIVQEMARRDREGIDRLILYGSGSVGVLPGRFETIDQSKRRAREDGPIATARRIAATWFLEREKAAAYEACAEIAEQSAPAAIPAGLDAMQGWAGSDFLPDITSQTLVLWGDGDRTYPWDQTYTLWKGIPAAGLAVVPGCAHAVHLEKPQIFNQLVLDFLGS